MHLPSALFTTKQEQKVVNERNINTIIFYYEAKNMFIFLKLHLFINKKISLTL